MRRNRIASVGYAGRFFLMVLALFLFAVIYTLPAWAQTQTCSDFDTQAEAQAALDDDPDLADELVSEGDTEACEDFDFSDDGDDSGASARAGNAEADAAGGATVELTCEQLIRIEEGDDGQYNAADGQYNEDLIAELRQRCEGRASADVIASTIPDGTLADTGGPSPTLYGALALGFVLVGGGALLFRSINR